MEKRKANKMFDNKVLQAVGFYRREIISTAGRTPLLASRSELLKEQRPQGSADWPQPNRYLRSAVPWLPPSTYPKRKSKATA